MFLLYFNDLNMAVAHSKVHKFADYSNFSDASHSLKHLNKTINFDLSNLVQWLRTNKISLNVNTEICSNVRTEIVVFRPVTKIYV